VWQKFLNFFHLSPRSKKNAQKWDLTTAYATKLKLGDPKTETFGLGGVTDAENTCQVAKDAPISSTEKVTQEIEEIDSKHSLKQQAQLHQQVKSGHHRSTINHPV